MNVKPSISAIRRIFFSPVDEEKIKKGREQHQRDIHELNIMNIR